MNPLILLPLLASAVLAAPQGLVAPVVLTGAVHTPLQQTVHYDVKNVVTGYNSAILKPVLPGQVAHTVVAPAGVVAAPGLVTFQLPELPQVPAIPGAPMAPGMNNDTMMGGSQPMLPAQPELPMIPAQPELPMLPGQPELPMIPGAPGAPSTTAKPEEGMEGQAPADAGMQSTTQSPLPQIPGVPAIPNFPPSVFTAPLVATANDDTVVVEARNAAIVGSPVIQNGPFVHQQAVWAPGRTHTHITPQIVQTQPEVTLRKVIHEVPVATPVFAHQQPQFVFTV